MPPFAFLRPLLALALCAFALPATAQINPGFDPSVPIRVVYRVDTTPPLAAFAAGFSAQGINEDLLALTSGVACNNPIALYGPAWVSTTADRDQAVQFARRHLERTPWQGQIRPTVYIYAIRADAAFISVPGAFYSAIDAGFGNRAGYTPEHANALEYLLYTRPILGERAVVSTQVNPRNIATATPLWLEGSALVEASAPISNVGYRHDPQTAAMNVVPDARLRSLLMPEAIRAANGTASGSCAMACDRATSASSFASQAGVLDHAQQCTASDAMSPLLFDINND